ncbi:MAG: protein TolQ [Deltaproteobacteria bacterium]|nr:protein TolQ [Deltaproteobacteria bacterium]
MPAGLAASLDIARLLEQAHWVVKGVVITLTVMFIVGLYIIIYKTMYLRRAASESARFLESFWRSRDIEQIYKQAQALRNSPISQMFVAGYTELAKLASDDNLKDDREGNLTNIERSLRRAQLSETLKLESMVPFLATTGSAAPFIGLFGTVVGIMFAFVEISAAAGAATLKVVGPHIAEALFATAIGLVAAIPAVMAYNFFMRRIRVLRSEMETFEQDYLNIIKRHFLR